ncbi:MAG: pilus assembly protein [Actinobacteria bacterium]|nr:pilus assembly protein [Actinomycetota bacterium]MCG2798249.1 pilus assembly protein [Cellulomonas sp.]
MSLRRARLAAAGGRDDGNALVEFLALAFVLLIPVAYLVLTLGRLQAAVFATEAAARGAARVYVTSEDVDLAGARALTATDLALDDQGFDDDPTQALRLTCTTSPCLSPGGQVTAEVTAQVPLPFVPGFVRDRVPLSVPVSAVRTAAVDEYRAGRG